MRLILIIFLLLPSITIIGQCSIGTDVLCRNDTIFVGNIEVNQLDPSSLKTGLWVHLICNTGITQILDGEDFNQYCDCVNRDFHISSIGEFVKGKKDGRWEFFNENKTIATVSYDSDELYGVFTLYGVGQTFRALIGGNENIQVLCNSLKLEGSFHEPVELEVLLTEWLRRQGEKKSLTPE